ncbi:MAG: AI-2E family transporter [Idiomarina sp.]|nr:AI-2E family transporter [Idiomarina sp.]
MERETDSLGSVSRLFLVAAAVIIVLAGVKAASVIVVPLFLAIFIAVIVQPLLTWFRSKGMPSLVAVAAVFLLIFIAGMALAGLVVQSVNDFAIKLPEYRIRLTEQLSGLITVLESMNIQVNRELVLSQLDPGRIMSLMMNMLAGLGGVMTNAFLILLIVMFILGEAANMPKKIALAFDKSESQLASLTALVQSINKYLALKTVISLVTGSLVGIGLWMLGIDHYVLWAVLAFLLNYIPNIGSILAAVPAVLLALIQYHPTMAGAVALLFVAVNLIMGNLIEPKLMGHRLGLSTLVVFLSLIFWGWLLGPVGMLLSVPLTMMVKIALQEKPDTRWVAILLAGDEVIRHPEEALPPEEKAEKKAEKTQQRKASNRTKPQANSAAEKAEKSSTVSHKKTKDN